MNPYVRLPGSPPPIDLAFPQATESSVAPFGGSAPQTLHRRSSGSAAPAPRLRLSDLPPETFHQVLGELAPMDVLNLRQTGPEMLSGIPTGHQQWAMLSLRASAIRSAQNVNEVLNGVVSLVDAQAQTSPAIPLAFSMLAPAAQQSVIRTLIGGVHTLPLFEQQQGIAHIVRAIEGQPQEQRSALLQMTINNILTPGPAAQGDMAYAMLVPTLLGPVIQAIDRLPAQLKLSLQLHLAAQAGQTLLGLHQAQTLLRPVLSQDGLGSRAVNALEGGTANNWQVRVVNFLGETTARPTPQRLIALHFGLGAMAAHGFQRDAAVMQRRSWALGQTLDSMRNWTIPNEHRPAIANSMQRVVDSLPQQDRATLQARVDHFRAATS